MKENSPFTPGSPVPFDLFVGRVKQIKEIIKYINQSQSGKQESVFLEGERGLGKSSLLSLLRNLTIKERGSLAIHVFLGGVTTLEELVRRIFEQFLKESNAQPWFKNISSFFGKYIKNVELFSIKVSFKPQEDDLEVLVKEFPEAINSIIEGLKNENKGLFIVLDDIEGLATNPDFANWYKSFVDSVAIHYTYFPVLVILLGLPEIRDNFGKHQPSFMRIFKVLEIEKLKDNEVEEFFKNAFDKVDVKVDSDAMKIMVKLSSGFPFLMHEIGDAVFRLDNDQKICYGDATLGIVYAAKSIGKKYIDPKVYRTLRSQKYFSILEKIVQEPIINSFKRKDIESMLSSAEKSVFSNFLSRMKELNIIVPDVDAERGSYKFVNELYTIYIWLEAEKTRKQFEKII